MDQEVISHAELLETLAYDQATGEFRWRKRMAPSAALGSVAGTVYANGRRYITIRRRRYFASRLAWLYVTGAWPAAQIDHRNLDRLDNSLGNLREAGRQGNSANRCALSNNLLGVKGVTEVKAQKARPFRSRIRVNNRLIHLGYFATPEEANAAYGAAAARYFGEFARVS